MCQSQPSAAVVSVFFLAYCTVVILSDQDRCSSYRSLDSAACNTFRLPVSYLFIIDKTPSSHFMNRTLLYSEEYLEASGSQVFEPCLATSVSIPNRICLLLCIFDIIFATTSPSLYESQHSTARVPQVVQPGSYPPPVPTPVLSTHMCLCTDGKRTR